MSKKTVCDDYAHDCIRNSMNLLVLVESSLLKGHTKLALGIVEESILNLVAASYQLRFREMINWKAVRKFARGDLITVDGVPAVVTDPGGATFTMR